jgi:ubiquinone/menaquinone biosynthesis C-methylase UbiE
LDAFYGAALGLLSREGRWRAALADQIAPTPHDVILDIGCSTGALSLMLARMQPAAEVIGLDPRPGLVAQARARAAESGVQISYVEGDPRDIALHVGARTPTKIVLTLTTARNAADRLGRMQCARQVIDPAGVLHVVDYGAQRTPLMRRLFAVTGRGDPDGDVRALIRVAGFVAVEETATWNTPSGAISLYRARAS